MPTIDIPEKICKHCGGIRWSVHKHKDWRTEKLKGIIVYYTDYTCASVGETGCATIKRLKYNPLHPRVKIPEEVKRKKANEYHKANKHKWESQSKEALTKRAYIKYHTDPEKKEKQLIRQRKYENNIIKNLDDTYIKKQCTLRNNLKSSDIPQELIELKRKQLLLSRKTRKND